jgi:hypothetical protein
MFGITEGLIPEATARHGTDNFIDFLIDNSDPILMNADGAWWRIYSQRIAEVKDKIVGLTGMVAEEVKLSGDDLVPYWR